MCSTCGRTAEPTDRFCGGCGVSLRKTCGNCGGSVEPGASFCTGCGAALTEGTPLRQEDRRRVSVLFIDVVEFTGYAETIDPEQVRVMQNDYFSTVRRVIRQYGGVVEKYIGDAVMALFGAPVATENDALRCVRAGLELQRVLSHPSRVDAGLRFRVGIATGEALVDVAAAHDGGQAIVAGDVVNTGSRLQAVAPPGGVYVCAATYGATSDDIEYEEQEPVVLRGRSQASRVWLAVAARRSRPAGGDSESTPMVDREHERALLINALHRTVRNRVPQLITVFGEAGIGKSRLLRELARHALRLTGLPGDTGQRTAGEPAVVWLVGHCPPFGENVTYAALADVVKARAGILDSDDEPTTRTRLEQTVAEVAESGEALRLADALGPLLGLPGSRLASTETEQAWRRFVLAMGARRATVLVFEDLHWADERMLRFIEMLAASARDLPLLVLCTARPELRDRYPRWTSTIRGTVSIALTPLRDSDISTMYSLMFGQAFAAQAPYPLVELADGNPLYAQEYVRMLVEGGMLRAIGPQWTTDGSEAPPMPDNVHAVIANRLDLLDQPDRSILQAAAVVGREFWPGAVAAAVGRPVEAVEWALRRLEQRDLIQELGTSTMAGQLEYRFRHVLVRDVCYQRLPRAERVARHQRTADWLEAVSGGRQTDLAEVLANHRWAAHEIARTLGGDPAPFAPPARAAMFKAARRAYALHALDTAAQWVERARGLKLDDDPALDLFAAELEFYRDSDGFLAGGGAQRLTMLADTLSGGGDRAAAAHAYTLLGTAAWTRADRGATLRYLDRAVELYDGLPDTEEKASALLELARVHMLNFELEPAIAAADTAAEMAERLGLVEVHANSCITLATGRYATGDPEGYAALADIAEHCRRHRLSSRRRAVQNLAWAKLEEGDIAGSNRLLDEHRTLDPAGGHGLSTNFAGESQQAYFDGDWAAAIAAAAASMRLPSTEWDHHVLQSAWLQVLRGERVGGDDGPDEIDQAVDAACRGGFHRILRSTLAHAALCRALQGRAEEAATLLADLEADWAGTETLAWGEWAAAAARAGAELGGEQARTVRRMLQGSARHTPWVRAGIATLDGALTGDPEQHLAAAASYAQMGNVTDRMLSLTAAARALAATGQAERAAPIALEVTEFAHRNQAVRLLAGLPAPSR
ncbi:MAG TPA: adenylate/guanylate cyclase domain-containing protein [Rugosimonospora sp.]|nr:adenylate/guanylate cyclase domain-containing protein [Rugosimonospora sp.]